MNKQTVRKNLPFILIGILAGTFVISFVLYFVHVKEKRFIYYFHSFDSDKIYAESRRPVNKIEQDKIQYFIQDLLLGPMTPRYKTLFASGTTLEFCIKRDKILYVGLSANALNYTAETSSLEEGVELLEKNIVKNFTDINKIYIYIGGVPVQKKDEQID